MAEDFAIIEEAKERLRAFRRDDALSSKEFIEWNNERSKGRVKVA